MSEVEEIRAPAPAEAPAGRPAPGPGPAANTNAATPPQAPPAAPAQRSWLRRWRWPLIIAGPLVIIAVTAWFLLTAGRFETTDDAYVQGARAPVSASVDGRVLTVLVRENQFVRAGQPLFRLDARDAAAELASAEASVVNARLQVRALQAAYMQQRAAVASSQQAFAFATREAARQQALVAAGVSSQQQADQARFNADQARIAIAQAQQQARVAAANLGPYTIVNHPTVLAAEAGLERARLNQSYSEVVAPTSGIVTQVERLQPGSRVNASQTLFWLISGRPWVEANFKEDQLGYMRVGQPVRIRIDAYRGQELTGRVASFAPGTGSAFSALPPQNATGNWVKVTQRLPVRIEFDRPPPAAAGRLGLSAVVTVDVRSGRPQRR